MINIYIKKVKYENEFGTLYCDNYELYCEEIDTLGVQGISFSEQPIGANGQYTLQTRLAPKTVPATFALVERGLHSVILRDEVARILNPLIWGTLTVWGEHNTYTLHCRPTEAPSPKRTNVPNKWRWTTYFQSDASFWHRGGIQTAPLDRGYIGGITYQFKAYTDYPTPPIITLGHTVNPTSQYVMAINGHTLAVREHARDVTIDCSNMTLTDSDGNSVNYLIGDQSDLTGYDLIRGSNTFAVVAGMPSDGSITLQWYDLSLGVF